VLLDQPWATAGISPPQAGGANLCVGVGDLGFEGKQRRIERMELSSFREAAVNQDDAKMNGMEGCWMQHEQSS
jgi:hypothetical protein